MTSPIRLLALFLILFGIALRLSNQFGEPRLWLDELFSVAVAESPTWDVILTTLRFDTHPPLYYLQLHVWSLFGQSDFWYLLNSLGWSLLALWVMYTTVNRLYGETAGLWSTAIFAVLPLEVFFAENVRMYAFLAVQQIILWGLLEAQIRSQRADARRYVLLALVAVAITLSHGLGFLIVFFCFLQAGVREITRHGAPRLIPLALSCVPAVLSSAWPLVIGSFRKTEGIANFDLREVGIHLTLTTVGMEFPEPVLAGFVVFTLIAFICLGVSRAFAQFVWLVLLPFALLLVLSVMAKPVFIYRTMGLFLPYLAIALGLAADEILARGTLPRRLAFYAILGVMAASGANSTWHFEKDGYRAAVNAWEQSSDPDALVVLDHPVDLWALQRYLSEGARVSALEIQPPVRDGMLRLRQRLENTPLERIGFFGHADTRVIGRRTLTFVATPEQVAKREVVWVMNPQDDCNALNALLGQNETTTREAERTARFEAAERVSAQGKTFLACRIRGAR